MKSVSEKQSPARHRNLINLVLKQVFFFSMTQQIPKELYLSLTKQVSKEHY
jgi:hypothetical protein